MNDPINTPLMDAVNQINQIKFSGEFGHLAMQRRCVAIIKSLFPKEKEVHESIADDFWDMGQSHVEMTNQEYFTKKFNPYV